MCAAMATTQTPGHGLESLLHKVPPQDLEAEQSILGAILLDNEVMGDLVEILDERDFYREGHCAIFESMKMLYERREPTDLVTLTAELKKMQKLEIAGGLSYLSQLVDRLPTAAHAKAYAKIIKEKALLRHLIRVSTDIVGASYESGLEVSDLIEQAEKSIFDIRQQKRTDSFSHLHDIIKDNFKVLEELYEKKQAITGLATHYKDLDEMTCGLQ